MCVNLEVGKAVIVSIPLSDAWASSFSQALDGLPCKRRVLLSGTPMQNHLEEFFAMVRHRLGRVNAGC